ncbi:hypothetical protein ACSTVK_004900, partial [Escherichia coli]
RQYCTNVTTCQLWLEMVDVTDNQEALDIRQCFIFLSYENQCCHTSPFPVTSKRAHVYREGC